MTKSKPRGSRGAWGKRVRPEEWRERLNALPVPHRYPAARIIWWEFFAERKVSRRWPHLDDLLQQRDEVPDEQLVKVLVKIGAPRPWAERRILGTLQ